MLCIHLSGELRRKTLALCLGALFSTPVVALAQQSSGPASPPGGAQSTEAAGGESYWTPERLREARPPELPTPSRAGPGGLPEGAEVEAPQLNRLPGQGEAGAPPSVEPDPGMERRLLPENTQPSEMQRGEVAPGGTGAEATSSFGAYFTTSRVFPDAATTTYPYSAAGKLFFTDPRRGTNHVCSAAVLRPRVVATAGHCVTSPSTNPAQRYFFTNFLFVPAFNNGTAPFGTWTSGQQWVLNAWHFSDGSVPNPGDAAFLIINDRSVGGQMRKIGEVTGWLGYATNSLSRNHVTMLGYPCNLDSCARMQITNAGSFASGGNNTYIYGSAGRGGHSGGAWIQDFGVNPSSNPAVALGLNRLVGITSYGPIATEPKYLGSSILDANFVNVLTSACAANSGNC
jgi:V8-like Glu-specific endopeptidase